MTGLLLPQRSPGYRSWRAGGGAAKGAGPSPVGPAPDGLAVHRPSFQPPERRSLRRSLAPWDPLLGVPSKVIGSPITVVGDHLNPELGDHDHVDRLHTALLAIDAAPSGLSLPALPKSLGGGPPRSGARRRRSPSSSPLRQRDISTTASILNADHQAMQCVEDEPAIPCRRSWEPTHSGRLQIPFE
jgi:hypothetical protein